MSRRMSVPSHWFYRKADPLPPLFPEPHEGDHYFNTTRNVLRIVRYNQDDPPILEWQDVTSPVDVVTVPNEVAIAAVEPTDPEVELWVDPDGTWADEFATKQYVDGNGWIAPTLLNSWVNYGAPFDNAAYTKVGPVVYMKGLVKTGAQGTVIFTLPGGYRPLGQLILPAISNGAVGRMDIFSNGNVQCNIGTGAYFSICGSFIADL